MEIKEEVEIKEDKPVSTETLKALWNTYTSQKRQENKPSEVVILNQEFTFESNVITLKLKNPVQLEQLNNFKVDLLTFLRRSAQNSSINLEAIIEIQEEKRMLYTSSEKFSYLAGKNPALLELKQKLGLELDY